MEIKLYNTALNYGLPHMGKILMCATSDGCGHKHVFQCCVRLKSFINLCVPLKVRDLRYKESLCII